MNSNAVILASCFTAVALVLLILLFITKNPLLSGKLKNYLRAGTAVYLSGTMLLLFLSFVLKDVPVLFILISELMIMTVFIVTFILIIRLSKMVSSMLEKNAGLTAKKENTDE